jgi:hypothetical protein
MRTFVHNLKGPHLYLDLAINIDADIVKGMRNDTKWTRINTYFWIGFWLFQGIGWAIMLRII